MKLAEVQFNLWENVCQFLVDDLDLKIGDYVIVETDLGVEIGKITQIKEIDQKKFELINKEKELKTIIRKANLKDLEVLERLERGKDETMDVCKKLIVKNQLAMKLIDVHSSFDDKRLTFAFIANGRVDFRQLVKDLTRHFQKNIRLQQLGVRDEAKIDGDIGACGITQCCKTHLKELGNVNAEQAQLQQVSHRGAERLSGICGRLKCCLRYENDLYKELAAKFPELGSKVKTPRGKGEVLEWQILKQSVRVKLTEEDTIVEVPLEKIS
ncbi:MAG: regulatory iron-sulfur-containing complex subunit RicT [Candidatus Parcubacteria bacterium]|nr:regulatory iron-sulfur-containing complex subunit RicT [Candidatus Parcubacteria bacterium]